LAPIKTSDGECKITLGFI